MFCTYFQIIEVVLLDIEVNIVLQIYYVIFRFLFLSCITQKGFSIREMLRYSKRSIFTWHPLFQIFSSHLEIHLLPERVHGAFSQGTLTLVIVQQMFSDYFRKFYQLFYPTIYNKAIEKTTFFKIETHCEKYHYKVLQNCVALTSQWHLFLFNSGNPKLSLKHC